MRCGPAIEAGLLLAAACVLAGCAGGGTTGHVDAQMSGSPTVAFESIDGPPPHIFARMVGLLDAESKMRRLSIVSRDVPAAYRIRSYLSAQTLRGHTKIAWVWDVYDRTGQRASRMSGEEAAHGKSSRYESGRDGWAAADDIVLRRIAQAGLTALNGIVSSGAPSPEPRSVPGERGIGPAIASANDAAARTALGFGAD